jgi:hypothetical protein
MIGKYVLPLLAVLGVAVSIGTVIKDNQVTLVIPSPFQSANAPYGSYVSGYGIVESSKQK